LFLPHYHSPDSATYIDHIGIGLYWCVCIGITGLLESLRKSRGNAKVNLQAAQRQREQMEQEVRQRKEAETRLRSKQEQVELLNSRLRMMMRETQDRVRNNLQVITALVEIQLTEEGTVPATAMRRIGQHGQVLAAVHEMVTQMAQRPEEATALSLQDLTARMALLVRNIAGTRRFKTQTGEGRLTVNQTIALALLINELASNAILHGKGEIELALCIEGDYVHLEIRDEGPGFPQGFDPAKDGRTGIQLIE